MEEKSFSILHIGDSITQGRLWFKIPYAGRQWWQVWKLKFIPYEIEEEVIDQWEIMAKKNRENIAKMFGKNGMPPQKFYGKNPIN